MPALPSSEGAAGDHQVAEFAGRFGLWRMEVRSWSISWSAGVARIFGRPLPPGGSLGLDDHIGFYHPDDREAVRGRVEAAMAGRASTGYQNRGRVVRPDGDVRELVAQGVAERDEQGRVTSVHGIVIDMTETLRLERRAREGNELLRTTLENMDQGIIMFGSDLRVRVHNRRARDLFDIPEDLLYEGAAFDPVLKLLEERGEFAGWTAEERRRAEIATTGVYERRLLNGSVLEIRTRAAAGGGVVRTMTDVTERHHRKAALRDSERRYRMLAENTSDVVIWCDPDSTRRYVSPAARALFGYEPDELVGTKPIAFVHPDEAAAYAVLVDDLRNGRREHATTQQRYRRKDGAYVWVEISFNLVREPDGGSPAGWVASVRDISDRKAAEDALRISEERLALALDSGSDGFWDCDLVSGAVSFRGRWPAILGFEAGGTDTTVAAWRDLIHAEDRARALALFKAHVAGKTPALDAEYRIRTKGGEYVWAHARGKVVSRDGQGRATRLIGTHSDITERKNAEGLVAHMAVHDALTGLPNRILFKDRLQQAIGAAQRQGGRFAVLACDLDRFKNVNDSFGHSAGDQLLCVVAERLAAAVGERSTVARLGGDEFAVILSDLASPDEARGVAEALIGIVEQPVDIEHHPVSIGMSIGIAVGPADGADAEQAYKNADIALYRAKATGRNSFRFFERGMAAAAVGRNGLEQDLREAVRRGGLTLAFQPIVDLANGDIGGFEALLRWRHERRGAVEPADFIPVAEETGLILPIGEWVLREACRQAASWPGARVTVNVSAVQLRHPEALKRGVLLALAASGLRPDRLELEITEGVLMQDAATAVACLHRLRDLGVGIALDDFGTGTSSLGHLRRLPLDRIKIDKLLVDEIETPGTIAIARAVVWLAKRLGARVVAEGVETREQLARVRRAGCAEAQGFLFSGPLPACDATELIRAACRRLAA